MNRVLAIFVGAVVFLAVVAGVVVANRPHPPWTRTPLGGSSRSI